MPRTLRSCPATARSPRRCARSKSAASTARSGGSSRADGRSWESASGCRLLFDASEEHEHYAGLGILPGTIRRFEHAPRVPHMGWNDLELVAAHPFVANVASGDFVYFLHSYRAEVGPDTLAAATHGERFAAIVARDNVMGTQFHPEKSQVTGARLLDNFLALGAA